MTLFSNLQDQKILKLSSDDQVPCNARERFKPRISSELFLIQKIYSQQKKIYFRERMISCANQACLLKYFPKYYKKLQIPTKYPRWPVFRKLKDVKIIHHLKITCYKSFHFLKILLQNKRRQMEYIPVFNALRALEMAMYLPRIKTLDLSSNIPLKWTDELLLLTREKDFRNLKKKRTLQLLKRFWIYWRHLKHVRMNPRNPNVWNAIRKLNKNKQILSFFETFTLIFPSKEEPELIPMNATFVMLLKNLSFLSCITHLSFEDKNCYSTEKLQGHILQLCSRVTHLTVKLSACNLVPVLTSQNILPTLKALRNLKIMLLKIHDSRPFLQKIEFPESLEKIILHFKNVDSRLEKALLIEQTSDTKPIEMKPFQRFLDAWSKQANLRILEIDFDVNFLSESVQKFFLPSLFKGILSLITIVLRFACSQSIQLFPVLDVFSHLQSLRNVTILNEATPPKDLILDFKHDHQKMPSLFHIRSFHLSGLILGSSFFNEFMKSFFEKSEDSKAFSFSELRFNSMKFLIEFFQTFNGCRKSIRETSHLKVRLTLDRITDVFSISPQTRIYLPEKALIDLIIDFRAGSLVYTNKIEKALNYFKKTFLTLQVALSPDGEMFVLNNFVTSQR